MSAQQLERKISVSSLFRFTFPTMPFLPLISYTLLSISSLALALCLAPAAMLF